MTRLSRIFTLKRRRSESAVSTIMANLMMLIIVVTLSSMLFVWAISSLDGYQGGAGSWFSSRSIANQERMNVESVFFAQGSANCSGGNAYCVTIYVRNVGTIPFTIGSIYINSTQYTPSSTPILISQVQTFQFPLVGQTLVKGDLQTITLASIRGTVITTTWVY